MVTLEKTDFVKSPPAKQTSTGEQIRLLVCGDRNWTDYKAIYQEIKLIMPYVLIEGEANGADLLARKAAENLQINVIKFPANWNKFGKVAGIIRNVQMLQEGQPDLVLAFHDDLEHSKGTKHMVTIAREAGVSTRVWTHSKQHSL